MDTGDFVIIINADKIKVTGTKAATKTYYRHSGFPGGLKQETVSYTHLWFQPCDHSAAYFTPRISSSFSLSPTPRSMSRLPRRESMALMPMPPIIS